MLSLATIPLLLSFAAPDLGPYKLEPWSGIQPSWIDPLMDSLKPGGWVAMYGERRLPDGTPSGRDTTIWAESVGSGMRSAYIGWSFRKDTTRNLQEFWQSKDGRLDSMTQMSFRNDSLVNWFQVGKKAIPGGEARWANYGPTPSSNHRIDSFYTFFDAQGRTVATRTFRPIQSSSGTAGAPYDLFGSLHVDSIEWNEAGAPVRWRSFDSSRSFTTSPFSVRREEHVLTWDGFHLLRDSSRAWSRSSNGEVTRDSMVRAFKWDGPRLMDIVTWDARGLPLSRNGDYLTLWSWDSLGRMTRVREWRTETDLDSLFYGKGPWPERLHTYACSNKTPYDLDLTSGTIIPTIDQCSLEEVALYTYAVSGSSGVAGRAAMRAGVRFERGFIVFSELDPGARDAVLADPSGRILSRTPVQGGGASLALPARGGIAVWSVLDGSGRRIASGTVVVPRHR